MQSIPIEKQPLRLKINLVMLSVIVAVVFIFTELLHDSTEQARLPNIQGQVIDGGAPIDEFKLLTHQGTEFTNKHLHGKWHIVAYGYTQCPDICPTTLMVVSRLAQLLRQNSSGEDIELLFYTVDPLRDSAKVLREYLGYFDAKLTGLRPANNSDSQRFERSLGIKSIRRVKEIATDTNPGLSASSLTGSSPSSSTGSQPGSFLTEVNVSHSVSLLIINPDARLQAVFLPDKADSSPTHFESETLYHQFVAIRDYYYQGG